MEPKDFENHVRSIVFKVEIVKSLIREGKEIAAYEKLQGVYDNLMAILQQLHKDSEDNRNKDISKVSG